MAKPWNGSRARPPAVPVVPTTLTEITRRYYATALALSKAMGLPMSEQFLRDYREPIACCYIEAGRAGVRLSGDVKLPPLTTPSAPPFPATSSAPAPVTTTVAPPQAATNGHTPAQEPPKGAPKNLQQKSALLKEVQDEITRLGRPVGEVIALYQAAFGAEVNTWELVCGESLHTLKHGLQYLRTLRPEVAHDGPVFSPPEVAASPAPQPLAAEVPQDPQPAAPEPDGAVESSSAPEPAPEDSVESLIAYAVSLGLEESTSRRVVKLHRDLSKCRTIFEQAAERSRRAVA